MSGMRSGSGQQDPHLDYRRQQQYYYQSRDDDGRQPRMNNMDYSNQYVNMPHAYAGKAAPQMQMNGGYVNMPGQLHRSTSGTLPGKTPQMAAQMGMHMRNPSSMPKQKLSFDMDEFPSLGGSNVSERVVSTNSYRPERPQTIDVSSNDSFPALPSAGGNKQDTHKSVAKNKTVKSSEVPSHSTKDQPDKYGLLGLLSVIRMTDPNRNMMALGTDLTTLGLNLNADVLYATFASPWSDNPSTVQPQYTLPSCYSLKPGSPKKEHFKEYELGTLFFIFYSMPTDVSQALAAQELYQRNPKWKYHKGSQTWFSIHQESGRRIFFDRQSWETRYVAGDAAELRQEEFLSVHELNRMVSATKSAT